MPQTNEHKPTKLNVFSIWRKDLKHFNKTRDNHFRNLGENFNFTLIVRDEKDIGLHISDKGTAIIRFKSGNGKFSVFNFYLKAFWYLWTQCKKKNFDIVWAPIGEEIPGLVCKWLTGNRIKLVFDLWDIPGLALQGTDNLVKHFVRRIYLFILPIVIRRGDLVVAGIVPKGLADIGISNSRIIEARNGVRPDIFSLDVEIDVARWFKKPDSLKLLYQGLIHLQRGAKDIIETVLYVQEQGIPVCATLIGPVDDSTLEALNELVAKYGLENNISIISEVDAQLIPQIIKSADICLCPLNDIDKFRWSYPVKIYEYMVMSKPVVASRLEGIEVIVNDGVDGKLYNPDVEYAMARCIMDIVNDSASLKRMGVAARERALQYSWSNIVHNISNDVYHHFDGR